MIRQTAIALVAGLAAALVSGCSTIDDISDGIDDLKTPVTADWAASGTRVEQDDYRQSAKLRGPDIDERIDRQGSSYRTHLRGTTAKNGAVRFQVYVATRLADQWRNLSVAHDQDRIPIAVHKVSRKEHCTEEGCAFYEHILLPVSREYLETRARDAIRLDVEGPGGAIHVVLPGAYVQGFMDRVQQVEAARTAKPSARKGARVSFCQAKYAGQAEALRFCQQQARASYERLAPARARARKDSFTSEAKGLEACMREHNGRLGIDWMMVEHCFGKSGGGHVPAAR